MQHTQKFILNLVAHAENWAKSENVEGKQFDFEGNVFVGKLSKGTKTFSISEMKIHRFQTYTAGEITSIYVKNKSLFNSEEYKYSGFQNNPQAYILFLQNLTNIPFEVKQEIVLAFWSDYCKKKFLGFYFADGCTDDFPYLLWIESYRRGKEKDQVIKVMVEKEKYGSYFNGYISSVFSEGKLLENMVFGVESDLIVEMFYIEIMKLQV